MPKPITEESLVEKCLDYFHLYDPKERIVINGAKEKLEAGGTLSDEEIDTLADLADRY